MTPGPHEQNTFRIENKLIIYFDGVCNLCNNVVDFFIRRDKNNKFLFCSLQSEIAQQRLPLEFRDSKGLESVVVEYNGQYWSKSRAIIKALQALGGVYSLAGFATILPKKLSDLIYDFIAKNRYDWFGQRDNCRIPSENEKSKFL